MTSDPLGTAIWLAVFLLIAACVYQAAQRRRQHIDQCEHCQERLAAKAARRRPPSSRAVEAIPEPTARPLAPVDTVAAQTAVSTGPSPGRLG